MADKASTYELERKEDMPSACPSSGQLDGETLETTTQHRHGHHHGPTNGLAPSGHTQPHSSASSATAVNMPTGVDNIPLDTVPTVEDTPGLPRLKYNMMDYKWKLIIVSSLLVIESSLLPIALFYGLWYGTDLRHGIVFAIITAFFGLVTGIEFGLRSLKLILPRDEYRPLGTDPVKDRWKFDFTHMTLSFGYTYMTGILIGASIPHEPIVKPLAMPVPLFFIQMGLQLLWTGWANKKHKKAPCRISSVPKGGRVPPLVLTIVEDIVAVDGAGGKEYRRAINARYEVSKRFREMIARQNWFWGVGALVDGAATMIVIWTIPQEIAYGVAWASPLIFSAIWTVITVIWVRRDLRREKAEWRANAEPSLSTEDTTTQEMQQQSVV
ncbi:hypothetical protein GE21DRAFT_8586 [Neurospora crassa]|uniref:Uncharacterized protein n=1 Tax=Neurospora crassa (strain ATCC 24698 / 74-OR23-1A / CBS 708.71 / DSM 1257 / FGSC 987) TaxID=367110 RepID=Q7S667_NEUCR|nr:hypothetical protein NCU07108 [Neurospora crassa OR74A]EAA31033.2 hypothetical protein NCU07108 [Neurospora crassa OR74A]KHE86815.1 hypothetical protein GE21DRAFT_8586 [Neurospora crassa]|eukprot:XP_960269.2 hypothetical protein NCU07108 [Neurospora crassa OR74A]